jgi:uncharacterized FlaG/YvyC family protein
MTSLDKSAMLANQLRAIAKIEPVRATQNRQELATGGKNIPVVAPPAPDAVTAKEKGIDKALRSVSGYVQNISRELNFSVDEDLNRSIVTVLDEETGEIIRQIPTEEMLQLARHIAESEDSGEQQPAKGILFRGDA